LEDLGVDEDNIKLDLDWTELAQDRDQWKVLGSRVMNLQVA
jgi:hypothetical protein